MSISKAAILIFVAVALWYAKETSILLCIFSCVRATEFGIQSNNPIQCTIRGGIFIRFTYIVFLLRSGFIEQILSSASSL